MTEKFDSNNLQRFTKRADVIQLVSNITSWADNLNQYLLNSQPSYTNLIILSYQANDTCALPIYSSSNNLNTGLTPTPTHFELQLSEAALTNQQVVINGTPLENFLHSQNNNQPNLDYQLLQHKGLIVGVIIFVLNPNLDNLESYEKFTTHISAGISAHISSDITSNIAQLQNLSQPYGPLGLAMEYKEPSVPNSFIIRWDIAGSTNFSTSSEAATFNAYQNQAHLFIRKLTENYLHELNTNQYEINQIYNDQGDGSYLILPLPSRLNPYNKQELLNFEQHYAEPLIDKINTGLLNLGQQYIDKIQPSVRVSGSFGYVELNGIGRLTSTTMFKLAAQKIK